MNPALSVRRTCGAQYGGLATGERSFQIQNPNSKIKNLNSLLHRFCFFPQIGAVEIGLRGAGEGGGEE